MYKQTENVGVDLSTNEQIIRVVMVWEENKETIDEFLERCKALYPDNDRHIMHKCIHVYLREKLHSKGKSNDDRFAEDYIQATKPKKQRY